MLRRGRLALMGAMIQPADERHRLISSVEAERKAFSLLDAIETGGLIAVGRGIDDSNELPDRIKGIVSHQAIGNRI